VRKKVPFSNFYFLFKIKKDKIILIATIFFSNVLKNVKVGFGTDSVGSVINLPRGSGSILHIYGSAHPDPL
jgi:hypothetical protein